MEDVVRLTTMYIIKSLRQGQGDIGELGYHPVKDEAYGGPGGARWHLLLCDRFGYEIMEVCLKLSL